MTMPRVLTRDRPAAEPGPLADTGKPPKGSAQRAAVLTLTAAIIFQPLLHPSGPGNSSPVDILTIASVVTAAVWLAGTHRKLRAPYVLPVLLYVAAGAASGLVGSLPGMLALVQDGLLFAWCLAAVNVLSVPRAMRLALTAWSWSAIFWAGVVIVAWMGHIAFLEGLSPLEGNRLMFTFGDPNYASWYWDASIFVVYAARTPKTRWMRLAGYGMLLWALALSESNGGVLALGIGVLFLLLVKSYRRRGLVGVAATVLAVGLAVGAFFTVLPLNEIRQWAATSNQPLLVNSLGRSAQSSSERSLLIQESIALYQRSDGVLGLGPASTKPLLGTWLYPYANEAHDDFLAALVERGALGLFAFLLLIASAASRASPIIRRPLSAPFAAAVPRPTGIVAALLVVSFNSFFEEIQHFRLWWLLLGIVAVLGRDAWQRRTPDPGTHTGLNVEAANRGDGLRAGDGRRPSGGRPGRHRAASTGPAGSEGRRTGSRLLSRHAITNLGAQGGALAAVSLASLLVARVGGPTVVGYYALIRVLPWLFGVVLSSGLPTASAFFLAGEHSRDRRVRPTLALMAVAGSAVAALVWLALTIPLHALFFRKLPIELVAVMAVLVITQLWTVTAKGCCQGSRDIAGANLIIVAEELWFVPVYPAVLLLGGYHRTLSVVIALIISGTLATATGLLRLWRRRFFADWGRPSARLAGRIAAFGARGQLGNMLWLMNLRFDFILLGAIAGPAVLGIYAVASKVAELMRLVPTAINYVLYPRFASLSRAEATAEARKLLPRAAALTLALAPLLALAAYIGLPIVYGHAFDGAILPAEIIIIGLAVEGAAAVSSAFLIGRGRPGLNSVGMGAGAAITVTLDAILIPRYGALGGAVTSAITYLSSTTVLVFLARRLAAAGKGAEPAASPAAPAPAHVPGGNGASPSGPAAVSRADTVMRRMVDVVVAACLLTPMLPLLVLISAAVRFTGRGPVLYRQVRTGRDGQPFTMLKFRSMVSASDQAGPLITSRSDARITRVGALLRATKLDELPQLLNVLMGDMTLIGPRPEVPRFVRSYRLEELDLLRVRPGLTGPGQIFYAWAHENGDEAVGDPETYYVRVHLHPKLAIDLDYLRRRSLRTDLAILLRTALLLSGRGRTPATAGVRPITDND